MSTPNKTWQVGGKGGRRFTTRAEAESYEQTLRNQDGVFRSIIKTLTEHERKRVENYIRRENDLRKRFKTTIISGMKILRFNDEAAQ
jgi:hypothetical protein